MEGGGGNASPLDGLWQGYNSLVRAGEALAQGIARGEVNPIVAYGDIRLIATLHLFSLERLPGGTYSLLYRSCEGRSCTIIVDGTMLEEFLPRSISPCARNIPGCTIAHGPEEIGAG